MVLGDPGKTGQTVRENVEEELRPGGENVKVQHRPTMANTVRVITHNPNSVTMTHVKVKNLLWACFKPCIHFDKCFC